MIERMDYPELFPTLFRRRWPIRRMAEDIGAIDVATIRDEYFGLREAAPRRSATRPYFVAHDGVPSSIAGSNRREEHIAIALRNLGRTWRLDGLGDVRLLDYQVPLKSQQSDTGIGKIDLVGITGRHLLVVELKVTGDKGGRSDPPIAAMLEGLRYAAIVEANASRLAAEIEQTWGWSSQTPFSPAVLVLGEQSWWEAWRAVPGAKVIFQRLHDLAVDVSNAFGSGIHFAQLSDVALTYGQSGQSPQLDPEPTIRPIKLS